MKKIRLIIPRSILCLAFLPALIFTQTTLTKPIIITNVTVIDVRDGASKPDMTVVIMGDRISDLGKTGKVRLPKNAQIVDGTGKFLIPGLWDMHVHTLSKGQPARFFPLFIANGITAVRDMGGDITLPDIARLKAEINNGSRMGPKIMAAGPIVEGERAFWKFSVSVKGDDDARNAVDKLASEGADFIKVYNSLSRDQYFLIAKKAKEKGITFVGHIPENVSPVEAAQTGHKSIEHLVGIKIQVTRDPESLRKRRAAAREEEDPAKARQLFLDLNREILAQYDQDTARNVFRLFARNNTWQTPTLVVLRSYASIHDPVLRMDPRISFMPQEIRESWFKSGGKPDAQNAEMQKRLYEQNLELVNTMRLAGVKFLAGTDTPNPYTYPGFSLHDELELFVKAGFSPMEALRTATLNPAVFFDLDDSVGTVEKGKIANLILLEANPLENISNTKKISSVVVIGNYLPRKELEKMLVDLKEKTNPK